MIKFKLAFILTIFAFNIYGQKIYIKKSFFTGYKYSTDSVTYENVDSEKLRGLMKGDNEAIELLNSYETNLTICRLLGIPGGALIGWPLGGYLGSGGKWKDGYNAMLLAGGGLAILSVVFETIANSKLEESTEKYNSNRISMINQYNINVVFYSRKEEIIININYRL